MKPIPLPRECTYSLHYKVGPEFKPSRNLGGEIHLKSGGDYPPFSGGTELSRTGGCLFRIRRGRLSLKPSLATHCHAPAAKAPAHGSSGSLRRPLPRAIPDPSASHRVAARCTCELLIRPSPPRPQAACQGA